MGKYRTIVADPPWAYDEGWPAASTSPIADLRRAYDLVEGWGFRPSQLLTWCKPTMGLGPGGVFANTSEFVVYGRRGAPAHLERADSTWWSWPRPGREHSRKPDAFLDMVERHLPGPHVELFARRARFGWDYWGDESLGTAEMPEAAA